MNSSVLRVASGRFGAKAPPHTMRPNLSFSPCYRKHSFACYVWATRKLSPFNSVSASWNNFELGTFPYSILVDSKLRLLLLKFWCANTLLAIDWNKCLIACVQQHSHTTTQWHTVEQGETTDMIWVHHISEVQSSQSKAQVIDQEKLEQ